MRQIAVMEFSSQVAGLGVTVAWALLSPTIFAVSGGAVASGLTRMVLSHTLFEGVRNRFYWSKDQFREILGFGRWVFLSSILGFLISNGDRMLLGAFLDARRFGIYSIAALIVGVLSELCGRLVSTVIFPALNETYRKEPAKLKVTYYRLRTPIDAACCIVAGIMIVAGPAIIGLLYDHRYVEAGIAVQIMSVPLIFLGLNSSENIYMVIGKPWLVTIITGIRLISLYAAMPYLAYHYGLVGAAAGMVSSHLIKVPVMYYMKLKHGYFSLWREVLVIPFVCAGMLLGYGLISL
jgi:O-antigen/teichoic acid export membrane protein